MEPAGLALEIKPLPGAGRACVVIKGALDAKTVLDFKTKIDALVAAGTNRLVLDFEGVRYVNSTGIAYLINLAESAGEKHGEVWLAALQPKVRIILDTMGVLEFFKVAAATPEAIKGLSTAKPPAPKAPAPRPAPAAPPARPITHRTTKPDSERKTGRVSPPSETPKPSPVGNPIRRFLRKLFGR